MMLEKYRSHVRLIDATTANQILQMLRVDRCVRRNNSDQLFQLLDNIGYDQADLVLCLLRLNTTTSLGHAERIVGRPITHCPPALLWRPIPTNLPDQARSGDDRRIVYIEENPTLRSGRRSWLTRYHLFKVGLSVSQLLRRGVTRNDLRLVVRRQWVRLESA